MCAAAAELGGDAETHGLRADDVLPLAGAYGYHPSWQVAVSGNAGCPAWPLILYVYR